jgi:hypothetical protein
MVTVRNILTHPGSTSDTNRKPNLRILCGSEFLNPRHHNTGPRPADPLDEGYSMKLSTSYRYSIIAKEHKFDN